MGEPKPGDRVIKTLIGHKIRKGDDARYTFTISTGSVDRDSDTIDPNGWRLDNYRKNPVVLFGHESRQPPIGRADSVEVRSGALKADVVFPEPGTYPLADTVRGLVDQDILRATSVGFLPIKWTFDEERRGTDFLEQELFEFSIVPVPSNPEAIRASKDLDLAPLAEWAEATLDTVKGPGLWLPKDTAERVLKMVGGEPVSVMVTEAGDGLDAGGEEGPGETHAPAVPGSTPGPATLEPVKRPALRIVRGKTPVRITRDDVIAVVQSTVQDSVQTAVAFASGRLDD